MKVIAYPLVFFFLVVISGTFSQSVSAQSAVCAKPCIDINTACPTGTAQVQKSCPASSTLKCCEAQAAPSGSTTAGNGSTTTTSGSEVTISLKNPLKYDTVEGVLTSIMSTLKTIVATLAILMIVIGGIMYIFSLGNPDNMKRAKNVILAALVGLAIVIAAPSFLKEIYSLLGAGPEPTELAGALTLTQIARNVLNFLLAIIGILALIMLIISGIAYLTSAGNEGRIKQAKGIFLSSLIGIGVAMASLVLVNWVASFFS